MANRSLARNIAETLAYAALMITTIGAYLATFAFLMLWIAAATLTWVVYHPEYTEWMWSW